MNEIKAFEGKHKYLSNFYPAMLYYDGLVYRSSEAAFQAQKCADVQMRRRFCLLNPAEAKKLGRSVDMRKNWDDIKISVMKDIVRSKFSQHVFLRAQLLDTEDAVLEEGNTWGDMFWGVDISTGVGENQLGKILMKIREELRPDK